uniref:hypothetical protein n=1 Tax=Prevotella sp. TaxID=59823 RepID=UPI004029BFDD
MEQTLNHFENAAFSATACDMEGTIVYQNALSIKRKGDVRGKSVFGCHKEKSNEIIRRMLKSGESYTYEIVIHGSTSPYPADALVSSSRWRDVGTLGNHHRLARGLSYIR